MEAPLDPELVHWHLLGLFLEEYFKRKSEQK